MPARALEIIFSGVYIGSGYGGNQYASYRANPGRPRLLLSALRSPLCGDAFAAFEEREQCRQMVCGKIMDQWDSTDVRIFKLVHRPEECLTIRPPLLSRAEYEYKEIVVETCTSGPTHPKAWSLFFCCPRQFNMVPNPSGRCSTSLSVLGASAYRWF
jgi:hypothetical protein